MLRAPIPASQLDAPAVVTAYKNLKYVERDFRHIKADWHLRPSSTGSNPPAPMNLVAQASRSTAAQAKASYQHDPAGQPYHSFRGLLEHLATLTRNQVRFAGTRATVPVLAEPTNAQREAFELIGAPIPVTLR